MRVGCLCIARSVGNLPFFGAVIDVNLISCRRVLMRHFVPNASSQGYDIEEWEPEEEPAVERGQFDSWGKQYEELKDVWVYKGTDIKDPQAPTLPIDTRSVVEVRQLSSIATRDTHTHQFCR